MDKSNLFSLNDIAKKCINKNEWSQGCIMQFNNILLPDLTNASLTVVYDEQKMKYSESGDIKTFLVSVLKMNLYFKVLFCRQGKTNYPMCEEQDVVKEILINNKFFKVAGSDLSTFRPFIYERKTVLGFFLTYTDPKLNSREFIYGFIPQKYCKAESLDSVTKAKPLTPTEIKHVIFDVSEALTKLHQINVFHSDLHRGNIIKCDSRYNIIDFGYSVTEINEKTALHALNGILGFFHDVAHSKESIKAIFESLGSNVNAESFTNLNKDAHSTKLLYLIKNEEISLLRDILELLHVSNVKPDDELRQHMLKLLSPIVSNQGGAIMNRRRTNRRVTAGHLSRVIYVDANKRQWVKYNHSWISVTTFKKKHKK